jgi:hypothetical protein
MLLTVPDMYLVVAQSFEPLVAMLSLNSNGVTNVADVAGSAGKLLFMWICAADSL